VRATFLAPRLDTFGGDRVIGRYARGLRDRGHDVRVISVGDPNSTLFYEGLEIVSLGHDNFPRSRLDYLRACITTLRKVKDPGVVIATWTPTLALAVTLKKLRGATRTVWLAQDYTEMFQGLATENWLLTNGAGLCDAVVSISTLCSEHLGADRYPGKVSLIHSGLNDVFFRPSPPTTREGVLFVGDPIDRKGWPEFVKAWTALRSTWPDLPLTLVCRRRPEGGMPEGGRCLVGLSDEEVAAEYRSSLVYVCASRAEGWGLPALESMATGTPVVTTHHGGCEAYARDGFNCLTVPVGDELGLERATHRILSDESLREHLVAGGKKTSSEYSWDQAIDRFEHVCAG
jgi:glycosyltransferase involved in cell wall biosynthesis